MKTGRKIVLLLQKKIRRTCKIRVKTLPSTNQERKIPLPLPVYGLLVKPSLISINSRDLLALHIFNNPRFIDLHLEGIDPNPLL